VLGGAGKTVVYVAPGTDGSLTLFTEEGFERFAERLSAASPAAEEVRAFSRLFYGQAQQVAIDRQGRIRIPGELAIWAGLDREAVLLGVRDHLELWAPDRWEKYQDRMRPQYDKIAAGALLGASRADL
jgi:MraZ protein